MQHYKEIAEDKRLCTHTSHQTIHYHWVCLGCVLSGWKQFHRKETHLRSSFLTLSKFECPLSMLWAWQCFLIFEWFSDSFDLRVPFSIYTISVGLGCRNSSSVTKSQLLPSEKPYMLSSPMAVSHNSTHGTFHSSRLESKRGADPS